VSSSNTPHRPRRRTTYANVAATLALVLALSAGTAFAAHHYLITSTKQIKPSVLKTLRVAGALGASGATGAAGQAGGQGPVGASAQIAAAWGDVAADGALTAGAGVSAVALAGTGEYCITLAGNETPATTVLVVSSDRGNDATIFETDGPQAIAEYDSNNSVCSTSNEFLVITGARNITSSSGVVTDVTNTAADSGFSFQAQ
jgi:hypothetical protein